MKCPPTYVINLKRNPERKIFIQRQIDAFNLNYQLVDAIDKYDLESPRYRFQTAQSLGMDESNLEYKYAQITQRSKGHKGYNSEGLGRLACLLSHIKVYNLILENNDDSACILEDDAFLLPTLPSVLAEASNLSWDILMLSTQSKAIRKVLEKANGLYKCIMKSHNHIVLVKSQNKKTCKMHERITELLGFSHRLYPKQSKTVVEILEGFEDKYKAMIASYNPKKSLIWLLSPSAIPASFKCYKTLREYTACRLGGLPTKHSQQPIGDNHCLAKPAERHASAMACLLKQSAAKQWRQIAIDKNILGADDIPWHLYTNNGVCLRFVSPPCVVASHTYLKYSAHYS